MMNSRQVSDHSRGKLRDHQGRRGTGGDSVASILQKSLLSLPFLYYDYLMSMKQRILCSLPATVGELAALEGRTVHQMNALLYYLRLRGLVRRSERRVPKGPHIRGCAPSLWVRT